VVKARDEQLRPILLWQCGRRVKQHHRVDTAGHREHHAVESGERVTYGVRDSLSFMPALCHGILI